MYALPFKFYKIWQEEKCTCAISVKFHYAIFVDFTQVFDFIKNNCPLRYVIDVHCMYIKASEKLQILREFLYDVPFCDVPLWINGLECLAKWRLSIGK